MNNVLIDAAQNSVLALLLSVVVLCVTRWRRNPPLAHLLWLLVLAKLITPPIAEWDWHLPRSALPMAPVVGVGDVQSVTSPTVPVLDPRGTGADMSSGRPSDSLSDEPQVVAQSRSRWDVWFRVLLIIVWGAGAVLAALVTVVRIIRFETALRTTLPASDRVRVLTLQLARRLGLRRAPDIRHVESVDIPFVWFAGRRATIVLPRRLVSDFSERELEMILAHELAHIRRRDHWVRLFELFVAGVYWWNPLVWFVRRRMHDEEEACCDAWVRHLFSKSEHAYARVLLRTAELPGRTSTSGGLQPVSPLLQSMPLKVRVAMILECQFAPQAARRHLFLALAVAAITLPWAIQPVVGEANQDDGVEATDEFPHIVEFSLGRTQFAAGDRIVIRQIRGTSPTFQPGHSYRIQGFYVLASRDRANLSAYTTARNAGDGVGTPKKSQRLKIERGRGEFTLTLPMSYEGWPHLSFYPQGGGRGFGGTYFGTGDSVKRTEPQPTSAKTTGAEKAVAGPLPHVVPFELGKGHVQTGDDITIQEVRGTSKEFTPGHIYWIKGKYRLSSAEEATLAAYTTAKNSSDAYGRSMKVQTTIVRNGEGSFALFLPMTCEGWPHISLYAGGKSIGERYLGTGETVLRK